MSPEQLKIIKNKKQNKKVKRNYRNLQYTGKFVKEKEAT